MTQRAEDKAFFVVAFRMQPSEYDNMTVLEREALLRVAKRNEIIK